MKIGFVSTDYPPNGSGGAQSTHLLVENLREKGHEVEVLAFGEKTDDQPEYLERNHIESDRLDIQNIKSRSKIKKFAEDKELIHCYGPRFIPAVATLRNVKTVVTLNNYKYFYPHKVQGMEKNPTSRVYRTLHDFTCRKLMKNIDQFIALSTAVKEQYSRIISEAKIKVIPNMYDPDFKLDKQVVTDEKEILYAGRLHQTKGIDDLIEAMKQLEDYHLKIIGDGDRRATLEEKVKEEDLENRIKFKGYVDHDQLPKHYSEAGWFIHPGKWPEPFGRTMLEAMQMQTPVLATNIGGPKDFLPEKQLLNGIEEITEKIRGLDREKAIKEQNQKLENHSPKKVVKKYEDIYFDILK